MTAPAPGAPLRRAQAAALLSAYLGLGLFVVGPALLSGRLVGDADVDVWNHAWGYWWFWDSLSRGRLPWFADGIGAPGGGVLWFIDPLGAIAALPLTATVGPALAWNLVLAGQVAFAGVAAHLLARELSGPGAQNAVAGVAMATAPYLWVELANGISEVCAVGWVPAALWAAARATRRGDRGAWALLGAVLGLSALASFYYGLLNVLLVGALLLSRARAVSARGLLLAVVLAGAIGGPGVLLLHRSLTHPQAMQQRGGGLNAVLLEHNAVDPREWVAPGDFRSVNFEARYGEAFRHTLYLRWTVLGLAIVAVARHRRATLPWVALAALSVALSLGTLLWFDGDWVRVGGRRLSLPFGWLQGLIPALAITHPARLGVGATAIAAALAAWGLKGTRGAWWAIPALVAETALLSAARWPLPSSPAEVPPIYARVAEDPDGRAVLDLPAEVGGTMATSRYFWYQTVHRRPVPWTPDARASRNGDTATTRLFEVPPGGGQPAPIGPEDAARVRRQYGWIVLHRDLAARVGRADDLEAQLAAAFGPPTDVEGDLRAWRLPGEGERGGPAVAGAGGPAGAPR